MSQPVDPPVITGHYDIVTSSWDDFVTKLNPVIVIGSGLLFNSADPETGLFYLQGPGRIPNPVTDYIQIEEDQIIANSPATIQFGFGYVIEIRTRIDDVIHTFEYPPHLTGNVI